ncbi:hypothetical protein E2C01_098320 [Portunus trituberculatus]|uniref:Uncharacterized protein n=1 Tax=Portunus trituberculatus TaxID=210409 RepID=A0A5B7JXI7_PORTR|nr:hypothetical protein [Portunus trituberculatus]
MLKVSRSTAIYITQVPNEDPYFKTPKAPDNEMVHQQRPPNLSNSSSLSSSDHKTRQEIERFIFIVWKQDEDGEVFHRNLFPTPQVSFEAARI